MNLKITIPTIILYWSVDQVFARSNCGRFHHTYQTSYFLLWKISVKFIIV